MKKQVLIYFKMKRLVMIGLVGLITTVFYSCQTPAANEESAAHNEEHSDHDEEATGEVRITREQADVLDLQLGRVERKSLDKNIKVNGYLDLYPQDKAAVTTFIGGNLANIYVKEGDKVKKGQILARLEHPDYIQLQQELQEGVSQLSYLKSEYERKEKLYKEDISSGREYQKAKAEYFAMQARVKALKAKLKLLNLQVDKILGGELYNTVPVIAPIDGYVGEVLVSIGDFAEPGTTMFLITNNDKTHVDFKVFEKDIYKVQQGQKAYFTIANRPGELIEARIEKIGRTFEDDPKAIHVHAAITGAVKTGLLPGLYVEGRIVIQEKPANVLPEEAIVKDGEGSFIFVLDEDESSENEMVFKPVMVTTGIEDAGFVEVAFAEPLPEEARIVIRGAYMLSSELIKGELEHDD